jgi:hypothetical protein
LVVADCAVLQRAPAMLPLRTLYMASPARFSLLVSCPVGDVEGMSCSLRPALSCPPNSGPIFRCRGSSPHFRGLAISVICLLHPFLQAQPLCRTSPAVQLRPCCKTTPDAQSPQVTRTLSHRARSSVRLKDIPSSRPTASSPFHTPARPPTL